ncbi:MAG: hypothetical protein H0W74_08445 [Sphingosinicella sp.]|nr:hypothetical protein [Sphingosinicella sp.]
MSTAAEYEAKAKEALAQLESATSEGERSRLRRARGVYLKLAANVGESAARVAARAPAVRKAPKKIGTGLFK